MRIKRFFAPLLAAATGWTLIATGANAASLLVANGVGDSVFEYATPSGALLGAFVAPSSGGLNDPRGLTFGPDGNLYVTGNIPGTPFTGHVFRYSGTTGAFIGLFANTADAAPFGTKFGPDGNLYVANIIVDSVSRFNGVTGALIGNFVPPGSGGLSDPRDLVFGPDGNLYVSSPGVSGPGGDVLRYSGATGAFLGAFAADVDARGLAFGPDGNLYVADFESDRVERFNGVTGAFIDIFASGGGLDGPVGVAFGPDGNLYVSSFQNGAILRYNGSTGAFIDTFASGGGLNEPRLMVFRAPEPGSFVLLGLAFAALALARRRFD